MNKSIEDKVQEFEEKWHDNGDERYGRAKHNNTILRYQLDWLRDALTSTHNEALESAIEEVNGYMEAAGRLLASGDCVMAAKTIKNRLVSLKLKENNE